jgi:hypothetical protein
MPLDIGANDLKAYALVERPCQLWLFIDLVCWSDRARSLEPCIPFEIAQCAALLRYFAAGRVQ